MNNWTLWILLFCVLFTTLDGAPSKDHADLGEIKDKFLTILYAGNHNIVSLGVSFKVNSNADGEENLEKTIFFVEADNTENGERKDHSLFVLKNGAKTKLLDNVRDIAVVNASKPVYFAAKDGIYIYNELENTANKYGSVNDEGISIAAEINTGAIYYLNKQRRLYKVTEQGMESTMIDTVKNAQEITVDDVGNIYYFVEDKSIYVYNGDNKNVRKVSGVYNNARPEIFIKNPGHRYQNHAFFSIDDKLYKIDALNATAELLYKNDYTTGATALSGDVSTLIHFARDNKIYEFNAFGYALTLVMELFKKMS